MANRKSKILLFLIITMMAWASVGLSQSVFLGSITFNAIDFERFSWTSFDDHAIGASLHYLSISEGKKVGKAWGGGVALRYFFRGALVLRPEISLCPVYRHNLWVIQLSAGPTLNYSNLRAKKDNSGMSQDPKNDLSIGFGLRFSFIRYNWNFWFWNLDLEISTEINYVPSTNHFSNVLAQSIAFSWGAENE